MYYNHNLRTQLQEWKNRLYRATYEQFGHQLKYFYAVGLCCDTRSQTNNSTTVQLKRWN